MTTFLFPDNTVLCNFAAVDRLDLLESALNHRGRWTEAVAYEASRSVSSLPVLASVVSDGWLGEPIRIDAASDIQEVNRLRRAVFGGMDHEPLKHLGEAETCHLILNDDRFTGSWWISDDREALRYARFQGITTRETIDIVAIAVAHGDIAETQAFDLMRKMVQAGRSPRLPRTTAQLRH
ncbi:hypothetical protein [Amycolatopsis sp. 3B14]|uniref:hypothetical protein n=1 Tax=Amycolatopsis sp. 3B14 TaxID=3243600 RepID=UPI003D982737